MHVGVKEVRTLNTRIKQIKDRIEEIWKSAKLSGSKIAYMSTKATYSPPFNRDILK